jgi:hypothetical protein
MVLGPPFDLVNWLHTARRSCAHSAAATGGGEVTASQVCNRLFPSITTPSVHLFQSLQISLFLPNLASTAQLKSTITMEQDKRAVPDMSEKEGGEVPAGEMSGNVDPPHGDASPEQEDASAAGSGAHANAAEESDVEEVFEVIFIDSESRNYAPLLISSCSPEQEAMTEESEGAAAVDNADRGTAPWSAQNQDRELTELC